uniref:Uncharacterized protein n=1 Tax=Panagrolaimus davidi TaxID=227884 RepID=A0A914QME7_9BILA
MYQTFKIDDKCIKMDINKISSKLWIIRGLSITDESDPKYLNSLLLSKLYRCEFHDLVLRDQNISFEDFKFLASSAKKVTVMWGSIIKYKNEKIVMFDKIMECLPNIENLYFAFHDDSMINSEMMKNILKLKNFENLKNLSLYNIPESLSVKDISAFIKKYKNMKFWLIFCNISNEYKEQLDALVDEIIESGVPYRYLEYEEQDLEKETIMRNRYFKEHLQD